MRSTRKRRAQEIRSAMLMRRFRCRGRIPGRTGSRSAPSTPTSRSSTSTRPATATTSPGPQRPPEAPAQDGLPPSEGDPRFHQQMAFAVVMKTIRMFERALGRKALWRPDCGTTSLARPTVPEHRSCGSIRTRSARRTPITAPRSGPCCSAIPTPGRALGRRQLDLHRAVARHHRARDHSRHPRRPAPALFGTDKPRTAWPSMRRSRTSRRCSRTSSSMRSPTTTSST